MIVSQVLDKYVNKPSGTFSFSFAAWNISNEIANYHVNGRKNDDKRDIEAGYEEDELSEITENTRKD